MEKAEVNNDASLNGVDEIEPVEVASATLARLLEEVRNNEPSEPHAYNRMHNRHNR